MLAIDRSCAAVLIARQNAVRLGVAPRIQFLQGNGLTAVAKRYAPHVIVANPPYIPSGDLGTLAIEVQREPPLALDGGADGCRWYAEWLGGAADLLIPGGAIIVELGAGLAQPVSAIAAATGRLRVTDVTSDWNDIPRVLIAERI